MNLFFRIIIWPFKKIFGKRREPEPGFSNQDFQGNQQFQADPMQNQGQVQQPYKQDDFLKDYGKGYSGRDFENDKQYQSNDKQEIILSKLEVINAKLDNIHQRLQALEGKGRLW
ncbi:hypothetical protein J4214_04370 [Candidatus Woesearchaeota archaeon]|nr:hypothetical protein [Candidatus Woesearchaeota archaeon]